MKDLWNNHISNWRLAFIILTFIAVALTLMRDQLDLSDEVVQYIKYAIYAFVLLGYADIVWKKIKGENKNDDILDTPDSEEN